MSNVPLFIIPLHPLENIRLLRRELSPFVQVLRASLCYLITSGPIVDDIGIWIYFHFRKVVIGLREANKLISEFRVSIPIAIIIQRVLQFYAVKWSELIHDSGIDLEPRAARLWSQQASEPLMCWASNTAAQDFRHHASKSYFGKAVRGCKAKLRNLMHRLERQCSTQNKNGLTDLKHERLHNSETLSRKRLPLPKTRNLLNPKARLWILILIRAKVNMGDIESHSPCAVSHVGCQSSVSIAWTALFK